MLALLKKADRSFHRYGRQLFRAINKDGYMVDLVKPLPTSLMEKERTRMGDEKNLHAAEIRNLQWLFSSPKYSQVVLGQDGFPAPLRYATNIKRLC
jgi:hypothetical protein